MKMFNLRTFSLAGLMLTPLASYAGSPMNVDNAAILDTKHCHIETWIDIYNRANDLRIAPACNFSGHLELGIELGRGHDDRVNQTYHIYGLKGKTLLTQHDDWAVALSFSVALEDKIKHDQAVYTLTTPISFNLWNNQLDLHFNLGLERDQTVTATYGTWGVAAAYHINEQLTGYIESFGNTETRHLEKRAYQFGTLFQVSRNLQLDVSYGNSLVNANKFTDHVRVGLVYETDRWLK